MTADAVALDLTWFGDPDPDSEPAWQELGLCRQVDPEIFFPDKGGSVREAKQVCGRCEVRAECRAYALEHQERFGVWGGLTERERRNLLRKASA